MPPSSGLGASIWASSNRSHPSRRWPNSSSSVSLLGIASAPPTPAVSGSGSAPAPPPTSGPGPASASSTHLTPAQAFHRFEQACQRLRWKFMDLKMSYQRANNPEEYDFTKADAERNFKVDFHEFYAWIEQAIVLLLLIFGVAISRAAFGNGATHAYHHNVLKALEDDDCPVHDALGRGEVIQALWKAKELRNRWKDAAEGKETPPLKMYDLNWIVTTVLSGLEAGYLVAGERVELELQMEAQRAETRVNGDERVDDEWEWMVEAMDWEAA